MADKQNATPTAEAASGTTPEQPQQPQATPVKPPTPEPTIDELKAKITAMVAANDFGAEFGTLSKKLASMQAKVESEQREAKQKALADVTEKVQAAINKAIEPYLKEIESKGGDGVWFVSDWGEALVETRLIKKRPAAAKKSGGGGGGSGKKFNISTEDLLKDHGHKAYKDGMTYQEYHDANTGGNPRYQVRLKLLEEAGFIEKG